MRNTLRNTALAAATVLVASMGFANATVINGSFEQDAGKGRNGNTHTGLSGQTGGWDIFANVPGWTTSGDGLEHQTQPTLGFAPADGNYYVELAGNQNTSITQRLVLTAGEYVISFLYASRDSSGENTNAIDWAINAVNNEMKRFKREDRSLASGTEESNGTDKVWREVQVAFTVDNDGEYDLSFEATGDRGNIGGLLDNVQVTPSAVPVPAAGLMLLGAVGGLAAMRRRKRA